MTEPKEFKSKKTVGSRKKGTANQPLFYGGLKSKHELYFQMASLFDAATKGNHSRSGQWIGQIMAARESNSSGKFF